MKAVVRPKLTEQEVHKLSLQEEKNIAVENASGQWHAAENFNTSSTISI